MKVCLYLEAEKLIGKSGLGSAFRHQKKALELNNFEFTTDYKEEFDIFHSNWIGPKTYYLINKFKKRKSVILHAHTTCEDSVNSFRFSNSLAPLFKKYLSHFYKKGDFVIVPSNYTKSLMKEYGIKNEIFVLSNGVDADKFKFNLRKRNVYRKKYELNKPTIFSVGHVIPKKGIFDFVTIAKLFPENKFIWYGPRYSKFLVNSRLTALDKQKYVNFTGYVDDVVAAYSSGDIFLFPSYDENQGIVILEAASTGRPIIVRDLPTYKGWLKDGKNCLKAKNNKEFIEKLKLLLNDKALYKKLIRNGYKLAEKNNLKKVGKKLKEIYEYVLP